MLPASGKSLPVRGKAVAAVAAGVAAASAGNIEVSTDENAGAGLSSFPADAAKAAPRLGAGVAGASKDNADE